MKTITVLNGKIVMSHDGNALKAMTHDAAQYPGAVASVVSDAEYSALISTQKDWLAIKAAEVKAEAQRRILTRLPGATLENYKDKELNYLGRERFLNLTETGKYRDASGLLQPARALTASETAELGTISAFWSWVGANRRASNEVEADLQASTDKANFNVAGSAR